MDKVAIFLIGISAPKNKWPKVPNPIIAPSFFQSGNFTDFKTWPPDCLLRLFFKKASILTNKQTEGAARRAAPFWCI